MRMEKHSCLMEFQLPEGVASKQEEGVMNPMRKRLILTHILHMDFVKRPIKPSRMAGVSPPFPSRSALQVSKKRCG